MKKYTLPIKENLVHCMVFYKNRNARGYFSCELSEFESFKKKLREGNAIAFLPFKNREVVLNQL